MTRRPPRRPVFVAFAALLLTSFAFVASPAPVSASVASEAAALVLKLVNADRAKAGLVPLRYQLGLTSIAGTRASRMATRNVMNHSVGGSISAQLKAKSVVWYRYGEAIAYTTKAWGTAAAIELHRAWMASPPHRALLMSSKFNYVGVGLALRSSNHRTYGSVILTESADESGPTSWFTGLSVSGDDITWRWTGVDVRLQTRTAGLRHFDVQVRAGNNPWTTIRNDTTTPTATLWNKTRGVSYAMRVRATDWRGNVGAWTPERRITLP